MKQKYVAGWNLCENGKKTVNEMNAMQVNSMIKHFRCPWQTDQVLGSGFNFADEKQFLVI